MKTKTNARILAWLLSICLIAGILPAMPASYAQAADVITYNFIAAADKAGGEPYSFTDDDGNEITNVFDNVATYEVAESLGSDPFEIFYAHSDGAYNNATGCYAGFYKGLGLALRVNPADNNAGSTIRMNLKVKESGWYTLSSTVNNATGASFTSLNFALYPNTENTIEDVTPIFDCASQAFFTGKKTPYYNDNKAVYLNKDYIYVGEFSVKPCEYTTKANNIYIYNLIATPAAAPALAAASEVNAEYTVGDEATTVSYTVDGAAPSSVSAVSDNPMQLA